MKTHYLLFIMWFVLVAFWLLNAFQQQHIRAEKELKAKKAKALAQQGQ